MTRRQFVRASSGLLIPAALAAQQSTISGGAGGTSASVTTGAYADIGSVSGPIEGDVYRLTDSAYDEAVYDGSAWRYYYQGIKCVPMNTAGFAFSSATGSPSAATNGGVVELTGPSFSTTRHLYETTYPSAPFTLRVVMRAENLASDANWSVGLGIRESGTDEHVVHTMTPSDADRIVATWTNKTTFGSSLATVARFSDAQFSAFIMEYQDNGTNRFYRFSYDKGKIWQDYTEANTTFLTPDKIGIVLLNLVSGGPHWLYVYSWEVT